MDLTLVQLAARSDVSVGFLSQIELGKNSASIETFYRISLALGMKLPELFQAVQRDS
jgi:transcriptional regulator with XRE-family HTH domain